MPAAPTAQPAPSPTRPSLVRVLEAQYERLWAMLQQAVERCPDKFWVHSEHPFFVPARLAFHIVQAMDYHFAPDPEAFDWHRYVDSWETAPPEKLPDRAALMAYLDQVERRVCNRLESLGDEGLVEPDSSPFFANALEHAVYTLRHSQHHLGQLNAELKKRNLPVAAW